MVLKNILLALFLALSGLLWMHVQEVNTDLGLWRDRLARQVTEDRMTLGLVPKRWVNYLPLIGRLFPTPTPVNEWNDDSKWGDQLPVIDTLLTLYGRYTQVQSLQEQLWLLHMLNPSLGRTRSIVPALLNGLVLHALMTSVVLVALLYFMDFEFLHWLKREGLLSWLKVLLEFLQMLITILEILFGGARKVVECLREHIEDKIEENIRRNVGSVIPSM